MESVKITFDKKLFWPPMKRNSFYEDSTESERFPGYGRAVIPTKTKMDKVKYPEYDEHHD